MHRGRISINDTIRSVTMMEDSNPPLIEIADACGFRSTNYRFSVFKQEYGTTPKKYRVKFLNREPQTTTPAE